MGPGAESDGISITLPQLIDSQREWRTVNSKKLVAADFSLRTLKSAATYFIAPMK